MNMERGALRVAGAYGIYWSETSFSFSDDVYVLRFEVDKRIYPSNHDYRWPGFTVRGTC